MKNAPKAYAISELLMLLGILLIILALTAKPFWILGREIPMMDQRFNTQASTQSALNLLRKDVERSYTLKTTANEIDGQTDTFTLYGADQTITYTLGEEIIWRNIRAEDPNTAAPPYWKVPNTRFDCRIIYEEQKPAAVEIICWQQRKFMGKERTHFRQANRFFVGLSRKAVPDE